MKYHKIQTIFKRNMDLPKHPLIYGQWTRPEFEYLKDNQWLFTEKIHGTNIRIYWENGQVRVEGRNDNSQIHGGIIDRANAIPKEWLEMIADGTVLYGEGCGQGIQKGQGFYTDNNGVDFILFDVADSKGRFYPWETVTDIANQLGLRQTELIGTGTLDEAIGMVKNGMPSRLGDGESEGLVLRPLVEMTNRWGERIICKIKTRDFESMVTA